MNDYEGEELSDEGPQSDRGVAVGITIIMWTAFIMGVVMGFFSYHIGIGPLFLVGSPWWIYSLVYGGALVGVAVFTYSVVSLLLG